MIFGRAIGASQPAAGAKILGLFGPFYTICTALLHDASCARPGRAGVQPMPPQKMLGDQLPYSQAVVTHCPARTSLPPPSARARSPSCRRGGTRACSCTWPKRSAEALSRGRTVSHIMQRVLTISCEQGERNESQQAGNARASQRVALWPARAGHAWRASNGTRLFRERPQCRSHCCPPRRRGRCTSR